MQFSISKSTQNFKTVETKDITDLAQHMMHYNYSLGLFKGNDRTNKSFQKAEAVGLDFDGGLTLKEAKIRFANKKHILMPTKSHQIEKNGVVSDRFRVILFLDQPITSSEDYKFTMRALMKEHPEADKACIDAARFFFPSHWRPAVKEDGELIRSLKAPEKVERDVVELNGERGKLTYTTMEFLIKGATFERNPTLFSAAKDAQEQGYTQEEFTQMFLNMIAGGGQWYSGEASAKDLDTIDRAYSEPPNGDPKIEKKAFDFKPIGQLFKEKIVLDWTVNELLVKGGMSVLAGDPKSGKSTVVRQLALAVMRGQKFLNRQCKQGAVLYLALEEHGAMLQRQFKTIGVKEDDPLLLHVGAAQTRGAYDQLLQTALELKPELIIIDTLSLFAGFDNMNDYEHVNKIMQKIREIPRRANTHLVLVHHSNKGEGRNFSRIMGSQAIMGSVDTAVMFSVQGTQRYIHTTGRGITNFNNLLLEYDPENEIYSFKREVSDEF